jgi:transposase
MNESVRVIGLDYHDQVIQACVLDGAGRMLRNDQVANDWRAVVRCVGRHGGAVRAAIEACNGAADLADELVAHAGWSVTLAHPGYVQRMRQRRDKTDFSDARLLADLERVGYLPRVWLAPEKIRELRRLVRWRQQKAREKRALKLRIGAMLREQRIEQPPVSRWTVQWMRWLRRTEQLSEQGRWIRDRHLEDLERVQDQIGQAEARLRALTDEDPIVARLVEYKGVGWWTACVLRAEIGRFDRFASGKQLSHFSGLSPRNASSGTRQADAGLIDACNGELRRTLIELAHRLMRWEPRWHAMAAQMLARGKKKSLIAAAVGNRWLRWLWHQMKEVQAD